MAAAGARITRARIVDPSWFTGPALPVARGGTIIPDFLLTNRSVNLSYARQPLVGVVPSPPALSKLLRCAIGSTWVRSCDGRASWQTRISRCIE